MTEFHIDVAGDVVDWQTLLSGLQTATLEGASPDGAWMLSGACSWNPRSGSDAAEGDLTLARDDGAEVFASFAAGAVAESLPEDAGVAGYDARLQFTIDGGTAAFDSATGSIVATGRLARDGFAFRLDIAVSRS